MLVGAVVGPFAEGGMTEARVVVDADMQALAADAAHLVAAVAGDPMTGPLDAAQFLGVEVEQLAGMLPLVSNDRRWRWWGPVAA